MCIIQGCGGRPVSKGLCDKHRKRLSKHGTIEAGRPDKWGQKEKHELFNSWYSLKRNNRLEDVWLDFWKFVEDIGSRPNNYKLSRKDESKLYGPNNFKWSKIGLKGLSSSEYMRQHRKNNPHIYKQIELKKKYGITLEQYINLKEKQNNVCAICGKSETAFDKRQNKLRDLSVDHCHTTGRVRGLLCSHCNHAIGKFNDDVELLQSAIEYLKGEQS